MLGLKMKHIKGLQYPLIEKMLKFKGIKGKFVVRFINLNNKNLDDCFIVFENEQAFIEIGSKVPDSCGITNVKEQTALLLIGFY